MNLAKLAVRSTIPDAAKLARHAHLLVVLPFGKTVADDAPCAALLQATLKRRGDKVAELTKDAVIANTAEGGLVAWVMPDPAKSVFDRNTLLRKGVAELLDEEPGEIAIAVLGDDATTRLANARAAAFCAWVNGTPLPVKKKKDKAEPLKKIHLFGAVDDPAFAETRALAEANTLTRTLTVTPPNELTPAIYRQRLRDLASERGWEYEEFDMPALRAMGAGAFVAVAQGSEPADAAIVHLRYRPQGARRNVALVGKGICFDTGGHNLKPAKSMQDMHEDMNGSAVALGILHAATALKLPVAVDAWLALAQNHLSPAAYKQNEIVTALNGTTIEVVHTDAEGRMVLADTLTLAGRAKPDVMLDFATLTGTMIEALGTRYTGIFATTEEIERLAVAAGKATGERICAFPWDADYEADIESKVADVKQCSMDGEADHILATRFLKRFTENRPWLHMDLSACNNEGGLGAVGSDTTGVGVVWGVEFIRTWLAAKA